MADFLSAHAKTMGNEGGWANNPADFGGETYKGIARKCHPHWVGWSIVDEAKKAMPRQPVYGSRSYSMWVRALNRILAADLSLQKNVLTFYSGRFWDANRLGQITNQAVAEWAYDHIVNAGGRGARWLQIAAHCTPDGSIGPVTIAAVNAQPPEELLGRCEDIAGAYRLDRASADPSQIQFLTSWLRRDGQPESIIAMVRQAAADGRLDKAEVTALKAAMEATD